VPFAHRAPDPPAWSPEAGAQSRDASQAHPTGSDRGARPVRPLWPPRLEPPDAVRPDGRTKWDDDWREVEMEKFDARKNPERNREHLLEGPSDEMIKPALLAWTPTLPAHDHSVLGARFHWE